MKWFFITLGMEFEAIYNVRSKVKKILKEKDIKYTELKPQIPFLKKMLDIEVSKQDGSKQYGYGLCGGICRWRNN